VMLPLREILLPQPPILGSANICAKGLVHRFGFLVDGGIRGKGVWEFRALLGSGGSWMWGTGISGIEIESYGMDIEVGGLCRESMTGVKDQAVSCCQCSMLPLSMRCL